MHQPGKARHPSPVGHEPRAFGVRRSTMITIHKFPLQVDDEQTIQMHPGATVLSVQMQRGVLCLWAMVNTLQGPPVLRTVYVHGTGHPVISPDSQFVGTVQIMEGDLILHVFVDPE